MIKVLETFSGIGAQAKALERLKIDYEIVATADWDINAIIAYDIIHYGAQDLSSYEGLSKDELVGRLEKYTLSPDGKAPYEKGSIKHQNIKVLKSLLAAIERSKNLVSITDMTYKNIPEDLGLLTYSFPCQDLSIAGLWHGNKSGIDPSKIEPGDILVYFKSKKYVHTALGIENHKIADCTSGRVPHIKYGVPPYKKWTLKLIIRYTGE